MIIEKKVLVVDDYKNWREFLQHILKDDGYVVQTASSYVEARTKLDACEFDVVILDMRLIDAETYNVQGMELLKQIKRKTPNTGAVILTGYPDALHEEKALKEYGADAYLSKVSQDDTDFDIDAFSYLVARLMKK